MSQTLAKRHFHVLSGFHGCICDYNEIYHNAKEAKAALKELVKNLRESGNTFSGDLKTGYFEAINKTDFLGDYCEISTCYESECGSELNEEGGY